MRKPFTQASTRVPVVGFDTYVEAERAVDFLSDQGFPVQHTTISGVGLRLVENVLGRLTFLKAAGMGAASALWFGFLFGVFLALFTADRVAWFAVILWALLWSGVAGAAFGLIRHGLSGRRRDFTSTRQLLADRYEVLVDPAYAEQARQLLGVDRDRP